MDKDGLIPDWDQYFMSMAYFVAIKSKDQSTNIGAVIVDSDNSIVSTGYNSFVRDINDDLPERQQRPEKYFWFEHAERNSIYNAAKMGSALRGCRMYTQGIPCPACMRAVIHSRISELIYHKSWHDSGFEGQKWIDEGIISRQMAKECGLKIRCYDGPIITEICSWQRGNKIL